MLRSGREGGWCLVLPCSRSCWSYHGSSSSVTNSSIVPELTMGDPRKTAETSPSIRTIDAPAGCSSRRQFAPSGWICAQASFFSHSGSVVLWLYQGSTCFLFPPSPRSLPPFPLIPPPPSTGPSRSTDQPPPLQLLLLQILQTWHRCCNNSTSFLPVFSSGLTMPSRAARKLQECSFVFNSIFGFRSGAPSTVHMALFI